MSLVGVKNRIVVACQKCEPNRSPDDVTLIAVSKTHPHNVVEQVLKEGHLHFGENKVQEAQEKWPLLKEQYPDVFLHLIGSLQTNKARKAFDLFDVIHTLDSEKLARKFADLAQEKGHCPKLFIQVNIGNEAQKSGISLDSVDSFVDSCIRIYGLPVCGLMAIPPNGVVPTPYFNTLSKLAKKNSLSELSMGMSSDFETAIHCGATHIRVGSAIFGERES